MMINVLVAEDNPVNRELLRELLEGRGYRVADVSNGQEALDYLEKNVPDLLLLDLGMPVLDGFATVRRIREDPRFAQLPVLAVTAYAMHGDKEKILSSGFDAYLSKPIQAAALWEQLETLLNQRGRGTAV
ncbi:MAG TPA: response regulator [Verrucomicrobiae bacterium]|nr:response regulator [Verrucomicrobiae bacterium]